MTEEEQVDEVEEKRPGVTMDNVEEEQVDEVEEERPVVTMDGVDHLTIAYQAVKGVSVCRKSSLKSDQRTHL